MKNKIKHIMSNKQKTKGQAVVEMALVLPIFIFIIIGIFDFGRSMHCLSNLKHQCIQAARAGTKRIRPLVAKNLFTPTTHPTVASITEAFWQNRSPMMPLKSYNTDNPDNSPTIEGWGANSVSITVSATYDLEIITPLIGSLIGSQNKSGKIRLSATATEKKE